MRYLSVFSGVEAASLAWEPLGWEPMAFSEIDEFPSAVLAHRFPDVTNLGDITKVDWSPYHGTADLVVGGSPCQSFSIAGGRTGLEGASGLMWEYVRCVREVMPRWLVWENVRGALSSTHGEDFGCLLRALDDLGYGLAWRVLDAQFFGVAQRRERVFLVGRLGDVEGPCEVLFDSEGLRGNPESSRKKRQALAAGACRGAGASGRALNPSDPQSKRVFRPSGPAPTLSSGTNEGMNIQPSVLCMTDTQPNTMVSGETCGTLTRRMYKDPPITMKIRGGKPGGGKGPLLQTDMSATLKTTNDQTLSDSGSGEYVVRRLTPRECERLQGMPDDWTSVPYRGKTAEQCPDAPRYRAIGNSMAVPVMRWIGERVEEVEDERKGMEPDRTARRDCLQR